MKIFKETIPEYKLKKVKNANIKKARFRSSHDVYTYAKQFYSDDIEIYESFFIILLNRANNTIGWVKISQGGITGTVCDPKLVLKYAVESMACSVICIHNHPSNNLSPSKADIALTKKLKEVCNYLDIELLDHLIISSESYFSFADEGIL